MTNPDPIESILKERIKPSEELVAGYVFPHWEPRIAGIPEATAALNAHFQSLLAEKDAEIARLKAELAIEIDCDAVIRNPGKVVGKIVGKFVRTENSGDPLPEK